MAHQLDQTGSTITYAPTGDVGFAECHQKLSELIEKSVATAPPGGCPLLIDVRAWTGDRTSNELRAIATMIARHQAGLSKRCAVVCSSDLQYGLSRIFAVYLDGNGIATQIFRDPEPALAWLSP